MTLKLDGLRPRTALVFEDLTSGWCPEERTIPLMIAGAIADHAYQFPAL
jgi:hypothetical protein